MSESELADEQTRDVMSNFVEMNRRKCTKGFAEKLDMFLEVLDGLFLGSIRPGVDATERKRLRDEWLDASRAYTYLILYSKRDEEDRLTGELEPGHMQKFLDIAQGKESAGEYLVEMSKLLTTGDYANLTRLLQRHGPVQPR